MRVRLAGSLLTIVLTSVAPLPAADRPAVEGVTRTVYVTVNDNNGAAVRDLTAADFTVKEGGKSREVVKAEPATVRMRTAVMIDERLLGDGPTRNGIFELMKRLQPTSEFALITVGLRQQTVVDYTSNLDAIVTAINKFTLNPGTVSNVNESVLDVTKKLTEQRVERPVIVVVAIPGEPASTALLSQAMNSLRDSGAQLHAVMLARGAGESGQILDDGAKQSGGRSLDVNGSTAIPGALQQIGDDLSAQYRLSYVLPDGVKPDKKISVSTTKKGIHLRAPSAVPDK
jgi:VWFA-related protein